MNTKQKIVLWIGIVIIVSMCLFPPWVRVVDIAGSRLIASGGYCYLLSPPKPVLGSGFSKDTWRRTVGGSSRDASNLVGRFFYESERLPALDYVRVDLPRLGIQCVIVALITGGLLCTFTTKEKYKNKGQKSGD